MSRPLRLKQPESSKPRTGRSPCGLRLVATGYAIPALIAAGAPLVGVSAWSRGGPMMTAEKRGTYTSLQRVADERQSRPTSWPSPPFTRSDCSRRARPVARRHRHRHRRRPAAAPRPRTAVLDSELWQRLSAVQAGRVFPFRCTEAAMYGAAINTLDAIDQALAPLVQG